tara:strand:+ start:38 stop:1252 length:1215 start_codon:yes stop_codon:yes gene_type:complete
MSTISRENLPEIHPFTFLRILKDFFDISSIKEKLRGSMTRRRRENLDMIMGGSWLHRTDSTMEFFNGKYYGVNDNLHGGLSIGQGYHAGPASNRYLNSEGDDDLVGTPGDINEYYKRWDCEGDFVHKYNLGIGYKHTTEELDWVELGEGVRQRFRVHNFANVYSDENIYSDPNPEYKPDNMIINLSKTEKLVYIQMFLTRLCEEYDGEEENSPVDRATWYEVSEFIRFYHDIWFSFNTRVGDDECWEYEGITTGPMTHANHERSTMYQIPGVWHPDDGGKWSENFETIMKLQVDDWRNSIWKKKYETYLQRIFEEDQVSIYSPITEINLLSDAQRWVGYQTWNGPLLLEESEESEEEKEEEKEELTTNEKLKNLMDYVFEKSEDLPNGIYLELCNRLKDIHDTL